MSTNTQTTEESGVTRVSCEGAVDMLDVRRMHEELSAVLATGGSVELDLSGVTKIGTGALQVLAAFTRDAPDVGASYTWINPADIVTATAKELGLSEHLGLSESASPSDPTPNKEVS